MKNNRLLSTVLVLFLLLIPSLRSHAAPDLKLLEKAVKMAKSVEGSRISEYRLLDQDMKEFKTSDYAGKPLLVSFIYTTCPDICNSTVATLAPAIEEVKREMGAEFNALIVGFDTEFDTPEMMKEFGLHHDTDFDLVRFGTGDKETIERMTKDLGFYYEEMEDGGFNHLGLVTVVDSEGMIYDQIYKSKITSADLRVPLNHLITGNIPEKKAPTFLAQLKGLCLKYDPDTGEYYLDYPYLLGVFLQALVIFLIAWFFLKKGNVADKKTKPMN